MDLYIQIIVVACLTGMTSLLAHRSAAVFHDGIRPILPQLIEGYMNRREAGSIAFGLSIGFVASVGISLPENRAAQRMVTLSSYRYPRRPGDKQPDGVWSWRYLGRVDPYLPVASKPAADRAAGGCIR